MKLLTQISFWLVIIGALNWGLIGLFGFNLVSTLLGEASLLSRLVYILVGLSSLLVIRDFFKEEKTVK